MDLLSGPASAAMEREICGSPADTYLQKLTRAAWRWILDP
jgi:hypothetical protein